MIHGEYPLIFAYFFGRFTPDGWNFQYWGFHPVGTTHHRDGDVS